MLALRCALRNNEQIARGRKEKRFSAFIAIRDSRKKKTAKRKMRS